MSLKRTILILLIPLFLLSCETLKVDYDYNRNTDFGQYKTFAIYSLKNVKRPISTLNAERVINSIKSEMTKKGFTEDPQNPDLMVNAVVILKDTQYVTANTNYYGYGGVYRPYGWDDYTAVTTYDLTKYTNGSLIIDIIDARAQKLIWQGTGNKEVDAPMKNPDTKVPEIVSKIMANFPPKAKKGKK